MKDLNFADAVRHAFGSLSKEFDLKVVETVDDRWESAVSLANDGAAIRVARDNREGAIFVTIHRLSEPGPPPARTIAERRRDPFNGFDVNDLFALRNPDARVEQRPARSPAELNTILGRYAQSISRSAADVLRAEFAVFDELAPARGKANTTIARSGKVHRTGQPIVSRCGGQSRVSDV